MMADWTPSRTLHPAEESVRFAEIGKALDSLQDELAQAGRRAMAEPIALAERQSAQIVAMADDQQVSQLQVDATPAASAIHKVLVRAYERGKAEVESEIAAQMNAHGVRMAESRRHGRSISDRLAILDALAQQAATGIADAVKRVLSARALREIETGVSPTGPGYDPQMALRAAVRGAALNVTSAAFSDGRADALDSNADILTGSIYSSLLDANTCEACAAADGTESSSPDGSEELPTPNPDCSGGGACRCMWVPVVDTAGLPVGMGDAPSVIVPQLPAKLLEALDTLAKRPAIPADVGRALIRLAEAKPTVSVAAPAVHVAAPALDLDGLTRRILSFAEKPSATPLPGDLVQAINDLAAAVKAPRTRAVRRDQRGQIDQIHDVTK